MSETTFAPLWASPPGATIRQRLDDLGLDIEALAERVGESPQTVTRLLNGRHPITIDLARRLAATLGASSEFWVNRDCQYREDLARVATDDWLNELPTDTMTQFGWLSGKAAKEDWAGRLRECLSFFGVDDFAAWRSAYEPVLAGARMRISSAVVRNDAAVAAWLRQASRQAEAIATDAWSPEKLVGTLPALRTLTRKKDPAQFMPELQQLLAGAGVALVAVRGLPGCPASGAARALSDERSLIVVSIRYLVDDQFWFTVFHEIGHLLLHPGDGPILDDPGGDEADSIEEREANEFAANTLFPPDVRAAVPGGRLSHRDIIGLARRAGVAPGIVVGQLQHGNRLAPSQLNSLKRRYRWNGPSLEMA